MNIIIKKELQINEKLDNIFVNDHYLREIFVSL